jgi:hypothetical protein
MDKVQKPSNSECYTPSPESFRFHPLLASSKASMFVLPVFRQNVMSEKTALSAAGSSLVQNWAHRQVTLTQYFRDFHRPLNAKPESYYLISVTVNEGSGMSCEGII